MTHSQRIVDQRETNNKYRFGSGNGSVSNAFIQARRRRVPGRRYHRFRARWDRRGISRRARPNPGGEPPARPARPDPVAGQSPIPARQELLHAWKRWRARRRTDEGGFKLTIERMNDHGEGHGGPTWNGKTSPIEPIRNPPRFASLPAAFIPASSAGPAVGSRPRPAARAGRATAPGSGRLDSFAAAIVPPGRECRHRRRATAP